MKHFPKMFVLAVLGMAITLFYGSAISSAYAVPPVQDADEEIEETPYTEEEYNAYMAASQEPEAMKRGEMLLAFIEEYPESTLMTYIDQAYKSLLFECSNGGKYEELETLAEHWLRLHPDDLQMVAYIVTAADKLGHDEKLIEYLLKLYEAEPTSERATYIAQNYNKMGDTPKYLEWVEKVLAYPEHASNFAMRYDIVQHYVSEQNFAKAAQYARMTLEAAKLVKQPSVDTLKNMRAVQNACHHLIGINQYEAGKYAEAIQSFEKAITAEVYSEGYYYIGMCQRNQDLIDDAMISLAKAEKLGGEVAPKAKEYLEKLYKALHNNTLIGIEKVYRKAQEQLEAAKEPQSNEPKSNMDLQKSETTELAASKVD